MRRAVRRFPGGLFAFCVVASLLFHFASFAPIAVMNLWESSEKPKAKPVQIKVVEAKPKLKKDTPDQSDPAKQVIEVPLRPTAAPKDSKFAGLQDHKTAKETRLKERLSRPKAANAGARGQKTAAKKKAQPQPKTAKPAAKKELSIADFAQRPSSRKLDRMVPSMNAGDPNAGYFDFVADTDIEIGETLDLNTTKTEFVGFFAQFRKSLQLVWVYPRAAAQKGQEGIVGLNIIFKKDGTAKAVNLRRSSGSKILDKAIVEAIWLAQPFGNLPSTYQKETLTVTANFHYHLRAH